MEELDVLVRRTQSGDLSAFAEIVRRFRDMACGYAHSRLGDFQSAEDASQEAFVEAFYKLGDLREAAAFPGWFRTIVFKQCDRIRRRRRGDTVPLDETHESIAVPGDESNDEVLAAVAALPERQREVTMLFYMNGYSQQEVAEFLDVPLTTVKKRLHDARQRLKEALMDTVRTALARHAPDERFSEKVMDALVERPKLLEIPGHPVREIWETILAHLAGWVVVDGPERMERALYPSVQDALDKVYEYDAYQVDIDTVLRSHMTGVTFSALKGRVPPARLLAAGRVFRPEPQEGARTQKVFHQADGVCVATGVDVAEMRRTCAGVIKSAIGERAVKWSGEDFPYVDNSESLQVRADGGWLDVLGCGLLKPAMLRDAGYDPGTVSGYAFGVGLERLAMLKHGIDDIRRLWQAPYVKGREPS